MFLAKFSAPLPLPRDRDQIPRSSRVSDNPFGKRVAEGRQPVDLSSVAGVLDDPHMLMILFRFKMTRI